MVFVKNVLDIVLLVQVLKEANVLLVDKVIKMELKNVWNVPN